jgi:hypothetical protein
MESKSWAFSSASYTGMEGKKDVKGDIMPRVGGTIFIMTEVKT